MKLKYIMLEDLEIIIKYAKALTTGKVQECKKTSRKVGNKNSEHRVNFNNICDDALKLITEASRAINDLNEYERSNPEIAKNYYHEVNEKCMNIIYSMMDENDKTKGDIYHFDVISFLANIGVMHGRYDGLKKNAIDKVNTFRKNIEKYSPHDAIGMLLVIKGTNRYWMYY